MRGIKNSWWQHRCSNSPLVDSPKNLTQLTYLRIDMRRNIKLSITERIAKNVHLICKSLKSRMRGAIHPRTSSDLCLDISWIQAILISIQAPMMQLIALLQHRWTTKHKLYKHISKIKSQRPQSMLDGDRLQVDWHSQIFKPLASQLRAKLVVKVTIL